MTLVLTVLSVVLAVALGVPYVTPVLVAAPVYPFFLAATKQHKYKSSLQITLRWGLTVLCMTVVSGAFVPARVAASQLLAGPALQTLAQWLHASNVPPAGYGYLIGGAAVVMLGALASAGALGFIVMAIGLGQAAVSAVALFGQSRNVLEMSLLAIPVWQLAGFAAGLFWVTAASGLSTDRLFRKPSPPEPRQGGPHRHWTIGLGLLLLAIVLRLTLPAWWHGLLVSATTR